MQSSQYILVLEKNKHLYCYVDKHNDGTGTLDRSRKKSFFWYKKFIETNGENL